MISNPCWLSSQIPPAAPRISKRGPALLISTRDRPRHNRIIELFFETEHLRSLPVLGQFDPYRDQTNRLNIFRKELSFIRHRLESCRHRFGAVRRAEAPLMRSEYVGRQQRLAPWSEREKDDVALGLEEDVRMLLRDVVFNGAPGLYSCGITGMAGIGKTTLARRLYDSYEVGRRFGRGAWVTVSDKATPREIVVDMIRQLRNFGEEKLNGMMRLEEARLQHRLRNLLQNKRYFIVLDDVGEAEEWKSVLAALPCHGEKVEGLPLQGW